jgi:hypothetical protein
VIIGPAAFAATENAGQDNPSQAEPDSRSYLPPWMKGQGAGEKASTPPNSAAPANHIMPGSKSAAADNEPIKRRVRSGSQVRRSHRHSTPANDFIGGFPGLFGGR